MKNHDDSIIPKMMGTEHELSLVFKHRAQELDIDEDIDLLADDDHVVIDSANLFNVPDAYSDVLWESQYGNTKFLKNGSFFQEFNERPLELATPECARPSELIAYSLAARELICEWAEQLLDQRSAVLRSISLHERVIDSHGNTWGEHDNFALNKGEKNWGDTPGLTPGLIWLHILTRGCVSGSGHINNRTNEWMLSQKLPTVTEINNKKWGSTGLHSDHERLEVRCSDKNISHWAHMLRLGSMALVMALVRTGYKTDRLGFSKDDIENEANIGSFDRITVNPNGEIKFSHDAKIAVSIQKSIAEACINLVDKEGLGEEYKFIAKAWYAHCEKLDNEIFNDESIDLSKFMHTDWAAKFCIIQQKISKDIDTGFIRKPFDYESLAQDLYYDRILLDCPVAKGKTYRIDGYGYKLNKRIKQRNLLGASAIKNAIINPPDSTRAKDRVNLVKELRENNSHIEYVEWDMVEWIDENNSTHKYYFDEFFINEEQS